MASTLFIMLKPPYEYHDLDMIKTMRSEKTAALLFEDATLFSVCERRRKDLLDVVDEVFVIDDDLEARGFKGKAGKGTQVVDYPRAVDLIMDDYDKTITM